MNLLNLTAINQYSDAKTALKRHFMSFLTVISMLASVFSFIPVTAEANQPFAAGSSHESSQFRPSNLPPAERDARRKEMQSKLGISDEQSAKLKAIREHNHGKAEQLHQQMRLKRQALMEYVSTPNSDPEKARAMQQEIDQLQKQISNLRMDAWFEMRKVLNPEQLRQMQSIREKRQQKFQREHP